MKLLKKYFDFINESFDLNSFLKKEKIPDIIKEKSIEYIDYWYKDIKNPRKDVSRDKLILWFARNIRNKIYEDWKIIYNAKFKQEDINNSPILDIIYYLTGRKITDENKNKVLSDVNKDINTILKHNHFQLNTIRDYIFSNVRNENIWKINYTSTFKQMYEISDDWHNQMKASGSVTEEHGHKLIQYPDGFYWIDLETNNCKAEGKAMGHCAKSSADTLLSLRQRKTDGSIEPFVTIAIDYNSNIPTDENGEFNIKNVKPDELYTEIYQCKGKNNKKPIAKYHPYIVDLYLKYKIGTEMGNEYMESEDFHIDDIEDEKLIERIINEYPVLLENYLLLSNKKIGKLIVDKGLYNVNTHLVSNLYFLMLNDIITKEDFVKQYPKDFVLKDDVIYLYFRKDNDKWKDITIQNLDFMYSTNNNNGRNYSSRDIINSLHEYYYSGNNIKFRDLYLNYITDDAKAAIINKIEEIKNTLSEEEQEEFDEYDSWEDKVKNIDALYYIKIAITDAYSTAQDSADENEQYKECLKPLLNFFNMDKLIYHDEGLLFEINPAWLLRYDKYNSDYNFLSNKILKSWFSEEGDNYEIEPEDELLKINIPYYGWNGDIDEKYLEEVIIDRLEDI